MDRSRLGDCDQGSEYPFQRKLVRGISGKPLSIYPSSERPVRLLQPMQRYYKEAITWRFLNHQNVLPLLGVPKDNPSLKFAMVSEWMVNGTISEFVKARADVNRFKLVCFLCWFVVLVAQNPAAFLVGRRGQGVDLPA